jgi:hypothetical protein
MKLFSLDAETNGLHGQAFAVAAVVTDDNGVEVAQFAARCPITGPVDGWVQANVLPAIADMPQTHGSYEAMCDAFHDFYLTHRAGADVIAHIAWPVEARLLSDVFAQPGRQWDGPFPLLDVAAILYAHGFDPTTVDGYNAAHGVTVPFDGPAHHPLYDAWAAERCTRYLLTA